MKKKNTKVACIIINRKRHFQRTLFNPPYHYVFATIDKDSLRAPSRVIINCVATSFAILNIHNNEKDREKMHLILFFNAVLHLHSGGNLKQPHTNTSHAPLLII